MAEREFIPPVRRVGGGWKLHLDDEERALIVRLMGELRELLTSDSETDLLDPLFPTVYRDDAGKEAEYQRLMRDELVSSRLAAIDTVCDALAPGGPELIDEDATLSFMQAVNAVRLVLGSLLQIDSDDDELDDTPEHHLYTYLSWILEWTVRALAPSS